MKSNKSSYEFSVMPTAVVDMEARAYSDGVFTETEDEGFYGGPNKHTTNIGWLVGTPTYPKSPHIDIYEAGQVKPPPDLNVKEVPVVPNSFGYHLSRSKSVCDLSKEPLGSTLSEKSKFSTLERKRVMERKPQDSTPHRSRVVRNRTILGSFPLFYKLSQSLSSLNTKSEVSNSCSAFVKTNVENSSSSDR